MQRDELLRMYGFVPQQGAEAPRGPVRSSLTTGNIIGQWIAFVLFGVCPVLLGLLLLVVVPVLPVRLGLGTFFCGFGLLIGWLIAHDVNEWVELDGDALRWKQLFSRQVRQRSVGELEAIVTLTLAVRTVAVRITESIFGRIKGFEFRFPDAKRGVRIFRADPAMTNVRELLEGVVAQMYRYGDVVPEIVDFEGAPLVRRLRFER